MWRCRTSFWAYETHVQIQHKDNAPLILPSPCRFRVELLGTVRNHFLPVMLGLDGPDGECMELMILKTEQGARITLVSMLRRAQ